MKIESNFIIINLLKTLVMKNSKNNFRVFAVSVAALFGVACTSVAYAGEATGNFPVTVKYIGVVNSAPTFQLAFTNENVAQFEITIRDKFSTIYYEKINGKGLVRNFQFVSNEVEGGSADDEITVVIQNTATKVITTYKILPNASIQKDTELIAKL
jgi:hypothetical protein